MLSSSSFISSARGMSKSKLVLVVVTSRLLLLLLMAASCYIIPDHNPGDDVLRFDLRLQYDTNSLKRQDELFDCFCLSGHACDPQTMRNEGSKGASSSKNLCADPQTKAKTSKAPGYSTTTRIIYRFLLSPVTKWDAARFLTLAANPSMRDPQNISDRRCRNDNWGERQECPDPFLLSEQAHAFFPLFPLTIRHVASILLMGFPGHFLPPTYESVLALAAILINLTCFVLATLALYDVTYSVVSLYGMNARNKASAEYGRVLAMTAALVFAVNPGSIFFSTAYSESMFALFTFTGHALVARSLTRSDQASSLNKTVLLMLAILPWMAGSFTRSNGTINAAWLLLLGIAKAIHIGYETSPMTVLKIGRSLIAFISHMVLAAFVVFPVKYHDWTGYARHCDEKLHLQPTWCNDSNNSASTFSLYTYTQRAHWNVGFLRYYQWKQLPNFLLAAPILILGFAAAYKWIESSVQDYYELNEQGINGSMQQLILKHCPLWVLESLRESADPSSNVNKEPSLLNNPVALAHYAVLAVVCLVGLTVAHVQISTRLICSSCPAMIWFMTHQMVSGIDEGIQQRDKRDEPLGKYTMFQGGNILLGYCGLYILLGIVLQVNFLPWT